MSVFAVNEIRKAEEEARKIKEAAASQSKTILSDAVSDGEEFLKRALNASAQKAGEIMADCNNKIKNISDLSQKSVSQKVQDLKNTTKDKIPEAVKYIIESII
ncbi:MAG: hypothetical protein E7588_04650 [Ruminococcaceae bacterium]|nr:hypothetical protein [Oscillospiraceae bacterium]